MGFAVCNDDNCGSPQCIQNRIDQIIDGYKMFYDDDEPTGVLE